MNAQEIWSSTLNGQKIDFISIDEEMKVELFKQVKELYISSQKENYKELVRKLYSIYIGSDYDIQSDNLNLLDIDFSSLVTKSNIQYVEQYLSEYQKKLTGYEKYYNDLASSFGFEYELKDNFSSANLQNKDNNWILSFIFYLMAEFINLFKCSKDKNVNIFNIDNSYSICDSLWKIATMFNPEVIFGIDAVIHTNNIDLFFKAENSELFGNIFDETFKEKKNSFSKDIMQHIDDSYALSFFVPETINNIFLYFKHYPKELNTTNLPRILDNIPEILSKIIDDKFLELVRSAESQLEYRINKFIFDITHGGYDDKNARDYCGVILDLIENTNIEIENTLFKARFEIVNKFNKIYKLTFSSDNELFTNVVDSIDKIIFNAFEKNNVNTQRKFNEYLIKSIDNLVKLNFEKFKAIKSMLDIYIDFDSNDFLKKLKEQANLIIATSPVNREIVYTRYGTAYNPRFELKDLMKIEMDQLIGGIMKKNRENGGNDNNIIFAIYSCDSVIDYPCFAIYKLLHDIKENKPHRKALVLLASKYNYDVDPSKEYFARKIIKWDNALNSIDYDESDLDNDPEVLFYAQGICYLTSLGIKEPNAAGIRILKDMVAFKKEFLANPNKFMFPYLKSNLALAEKRHKKLLAQFEPEPESLKVKPF